MFHVNGVKLKESCNFENLLHAKWSNFGNTLKKPNLKMSGYYIFKFEKSIVNFKKSCDVFSFLLKKRLFPAKILRFLAIPGKRQICIGENDNISKTI